MNDSGPQLLLEKKYFIVTIFGMRCGDQIPYLKLLTPYSK